VLLTAVVIHALHKAEEQPWKATAAAVVVEKQESCGRCGLIAEKRTSVDTLSLPTHVAYSVDGRNVEGACAKLKLDIAVGVGMLVRRSWFELFLCISLSAMDPAIGHACMLAAKQRQVAVCIALHVRVVQYWTEKHLCSLTHALMAQGAA
jgi:hypothetical protein